MSAERPIVFVVMKRYARSGDEAIHAFATRAAAEGLRDELNGEPYDEDDVQDYYVTTLPFGAP